MKIKVAVCTSDIEYSRRLVHYFEAHYYDRFAWNVFTDISYLMDFLKGDDVDIVLAGIELEDSVKDAAEGDKSGRIWAYLVEDEDDERASVSEKIRKYSRADKIYRDLLEIYSHKTNIRYWSEAIVNDKTDIYAFVSAAGGVGTSTIASATAIGYAKFENVLYINLENTGAVPLAFEGEGKAGLDEVIFSLKSRRQALGLKLASSVSRDKSGVYFLEECKNALNVMELSAGDLQELLMSVRQMKEYDKVILDVGNGLGEKEIAAMAHAGRVVSILEDNEVSAVKFTRYVEALRLIEEQRKVDICSKMAVFYNKILKQENLPGQLCQIRVAGGFPRIENGTYSGIVGRIAAMEMVRNIK